MPSPFPGMDPYLETSPYWGDLHTSLLTVLKGELKKRLPASYSVWSDIYIWLHEPDAETRRGKPDDLVTSQRPAGEDVGLAVMPARATALLPAIRKQGNKYLKIKEVRSERVITVIEFLSPANKSPGDDHDAYLAKRNEYLATGTNVVEIDLLRGGQRMPLGEPAPLPSDYMVMVCRAAEYPRIALWPISVRETLPEIAIPLKPSDGFVLLPLQACFNAAYDLGPYDREVDYWQAPRSPLTEPDATWARDLLAASRRSEKGG